MGVGSFTGFEMWSRWGRFLACGIPLKPLPGYNPCLQVSG